MEEGLGAPLAWRRSCSHGSLDRPVKVPSPAETPLPPPPLSLWIDSEIPLVLFIDLQVYWFLVTLLADLALRHGANQLLVFGLPGQVYLCCGGREARPRPASREQTGDCVDAYDTGLGLLLIRF